MGSGVRRASWLLLVVILLAGCSPIFGQKSTVTPTPARDSDRRRMPHLGAHRLASRGRAAVRRQRERHRRL